MEAIRQVRPDRHGDSWAGLIGGHDQLEKWDEDEVPARKMGELRTSAYAGTKLNARGELIERELARVVADVDTMELPEL